ncbi:MAG: SH3 domain-containing protein [Desulfocapsaceae bacterium]|nr:SH3 domain-containing protein [Desulfocapsaceae bacterium]
MENNNAALSDAAPSPGGKNLPTYDELRESKQRLQEEVARLTDESEKQKTLLTQLQLTLLKKHAEISVLSKKNDRLVNDFVRNTKNIQKSGNRVETVRMLAEITAILERARAFDKNQKWSQAIEKAEKYLLDSQTELNAGNIDGASYLANQAIEVMQTTELNQQAEKKKAASTEIEFYYPFQMTVLKNANVRNAPSLNTDILYVAESGANVIAVGYLDEWVKVEMKDGSFGWIYYSLLSGAF